MIRITTPTHSCLPKLTWTICPFLGSATNEEIPYLIPGEEFKDLNIFKFEVPTEDKDLLTETIKQIKL
jgi:hypothetical protein